MNTAWTLRNSLGHIPIICGHLFRVMAGLVPAIHALPAQLPLLKKGVDARDERGHDWSVPIQFHRELL
jgi:hypothetical protein